jgi:hypothetical protein
MGRIELPTSPLPRECSTTEPHGHLLLHLLAATASFFAGAGEGNRTLVVSLEGFCSTIELHPRSFSTTADSLHLLLQLNSGGGGWIRTNVGVSQQIYSLPPLATRAPLRRELMIVMQVPNRVKLFVRRRITTLSLIGRAKKQKPRLFRAGVSQ